MELAKKIFKPLLAFYLLVCILLLGTNISEFKGLFEFVAVLFLPLVAVTASLLFFEIK